jgi:hypothetical protein
LEQSDQVGLARCLQCEYGAGLEAIFRATSLQCDFLCEALERKLADQTFRRLLVLADLPKGHGACAHATAMAASTIGRAA